MDRWVEIDIDWFGSSLSVDRIDIFTTRISPLLAAAPGYKGVILNVGWLSDIVTEWTGSGDQMLPLRARRYKDWNNTSYKQLREFITKLRAAMSHAGVAPLRIGIFIAGIGSVVLPRSTGAMYDLYSSWSERHPELYPLDVSTLPGPDLDPRVPLQEDRYPYASRPDGINAGTRFAEFLGDQWGALSRYLDLDAIHLRDGYWGPLLYNRTGPFGTRPSSNVEQNKSWTDAVTEIVRCVKKANVDALVIGYSSAISYTAEWRVGCVDLEEVVADGHLDVWIDQTWGGAAQDWWGELWKGWTFQFANLLGHGVAVQAGNARRSTAPCRHYKVIETWDGWEPWDIIHRLPGKLAWGIWAFSHAAVLDASGTPKVPDGSYISWLNDWNLDLLSTADIDFLIETLGLAEESAAQLEEVYGPLVVMDSHSVRRAHQERPTENHSEWIEDQIGLLLKFGVPVVAATAPHARAQTWPEGAVHQLNSVAAVPGDASSATGGAYISVGRFDVIDPEIVSLAGIAELVGTIPSGFHKDSSSLEDVPGGESIHIPEFAAARPNNAATVVYRAGGHPLLVGVGNNWVWQPPDLHLPSDAQFPRSQLGTVNPYLHVAELLNRTSLGIQIGQVSPVLPVTIQLWKSAGTIYVLAANLETGWLGDSRTPRNVTVTIPYSRVGFDFFSAHFHVFSLPSSPSGIETFANSTEIKLSINVPPDGISLITISPKGST